MKIDVNELTYRLLSADMIPMLLDIQEETFLAAKGDTDFLRRNTPETLAPCFEGDSRVLGAFLGDTPVAFGILHTAGEGKENLAFDADPIERVTDSANVKLIIVRPDYRGNGIQRLLIKNLEEYAVGMGYLWLCATVAPSNRYSLDNFLATGFSEHKLLKKYGGLERVLLIKHIKK